MQFKITYTDKELKPQIRLMDLKDEQDAVNWVVMEAHHSYNGFCIRTVTDGRIVAQAGKL